MKKLLPVLLAFSLLSGCATSPSAPSTPSTPSDPDATMQTFQESGIRFDYPLDWNLGENMPEKEGGVAVSVSKTDSPDGYSCAEPYGFVMVSTLSRDSTESFDAWVTAPERYDAGGGLGRWGGSFQSSSLNLRVDPDFDELQTASVYDFPDAGVEGYCPMKTRVIDWQTDTALAVTYTADPSMEETVQKIVDSLRFEENAYLKNLTETSVDLDWVGFYGTTNEAEEKAQIEGKSLGDIFYVSNPQVKYETVAIAPDATVHLSLSNLDRDEIWAEFLKQWNEGSSLITDLSFKVELENGKVKKLTQ